MKQIIVMVAESKNDSTEFITIKLFNTKPEATEFIDLINDNCSKYWTTSASIVDEDERVEINYELNPNNI